MQHAIDDGLKWCARCDRFGYHKFCGQCGRRYFGAELTWRECPRCKAMVTTDYCPLCGMPVYDERMRRFLEGDATYVLEANARAKRILEAHFKPRSDPSARPDIVKAIQETFGGSRSQGAHRPLGS